MSGRTTIQVPETCVWKRRYEDGLFKWVITCENMVVLRQASDDEYGKTCGYCRKPVYFMEGRR